MFYKINFLLKNSILYKKKFFKANLSKTELQYINILIKLNVIKWVKKDTNKLNLFYIYISYYDNTPVFSNIINLYKPSKPSYIKLINIKKVIFKKNIIFILSTNQGILTSIEAFNKNIGGKLISQINF